MIDQEVPIIVQIDGLYHAHVQVICGYSEALSSVIIRDPAIPALGTTKYEALGEVYGPSGGYGMVLVPPAKAALFQDEPGWHSPVGGALLQLSKARDLGDADLAADAYGRIPNDDPACLARAMGAQGVALSERLFAKELERLAEDPGFKAKTRLRCLLRLNDPELFERVREQELSRGDEQAIPFKGFVGRLLEFRLALAKGDWEQAAKRGESIVQLSPGQSEFWIDLGRARVEQGAFERAEECLRWAEDVSPISLWVKNTLHAYFPNNLTYEERQAAYQAFLENYPNAQDHLEAEIPLLEASGDGLRLEGHFQVLIERKPLLAANYHRLAHWYLAQDRVDLAKALIAKARRRLTVEDLPTFFFEEAFDSGETSSEGEPPTDLQPETETPELLQVAHDNMRESPEIHRKAMTMLEERMKQGSLSWREQVDYHYLFFKNYCEEALREGRPININYALPNRLPGTLPFNLNQFLIRCDVGTLHEQVAQVLMPWVEEHRQCSPWHEDLEFNCGVLVQDAGHLNVAEARFRELPWSTTIKSPRLATTIIPQLGVR